jgi:hypothetical protein
MARSLSAEASSFWASVEPVSVVPSGVSGGGASPAGAAASATLEPSASETDKVREHSAEVVDDRDDKRVMKVT